MPMAENLLKATRLSISDIDGFAVAAGPGSFTGIRIGISAVKGLAAARALPCYPVSTLEAMAYGMSFEDAIVCPVMDARCNQVYNALFRVKNGTVTRLCEDRALAIDELKNELLGISERVVLVGDGTDIVKAAIDSPFVFAAAEHLKHQNALGVALAAEKVSPVSAEDLNAFYLRLPQAERELKKRSAEQ
jgi:tRNA threonylcarbamoyladenosine biosynthesis protein TsaB